MSRFDSSQFELLQTSDWWRRRWPKVALYAVLALVALVAVWTSFYTVEPEGRAVVKRFGAVVGIAEPGLHFKFPLWIDTATFVPTERVLKEEFGFRTVVPGARTQYRKADATEQESLMLTGDLNVIDVEWVVQYRIRDPELFLHRVRDRTETIRDVAEAVMRRIVGNRLGSDVLTVGRVSIAAEVRGEMQSILDSYELGVHVSAVELQDVTPPDLVKPSFNEVNEARQQRERLVNLAEKARNTIVPKAKGEAQQTISEAQAYAAERVNAAQGESARFVSVLEQYRLAQEVTRSRMHLETIDEIAADLGGLYVIDGSATAPLPLFDLDRARLRRSGADGADGRASDGGASDGGATGGRTTRGGNR